jgi:20S proteasome alpha/beta subunit
LTLVLAIGCSDGIVLASESASTDVTVTEVNKLVRVKDRPIMYGGSGDVGLLQKLDAVIEGVTLKNGAEKTIREIKSKVVMVLRESAKQHAPFPEAPFDKPPVAILLFAIVQDGRPWIVEYEKDGHETVFGDPQGNFAAIGGGKPIAQIIMRPHLPTARTLEKGRVLAYRIVDDAIRLAPSGLGGPLHIQTIDLEGNVEELSKEQLQALGDTCELVRNEECRVIDCVLAPPLPATDVSEIPSP